MLLYGAEYTLGCLKVKNMKIHVLIENCGLKHIYRKNDYREWYRVWYRYLLNKLTENGIIYFVFFILN
jgi:hypothetical protein